MMSVSQLKMDEAIDMDFDMEFEDKASKSERAGVTESFVGTRKVSTTDRRDSESVFRSAHQQQLAQAVQADINQYEEVKDESTG